ncbi:MAG: septum formation protein Maf [Candidatus Marinimicrobia bacterium CG08_land_8_20_14_0_20_45_22]|nr:MAG: septum formation protein Maf [Candidatus Marinimicrobia bacterium CG08_land_8_20_14_0_20_45_22]
MTPYFDWFQKSVVLASVSPRREEILKMILPDFIIHPSDYVEKNHCNADPPPLVIYHAIEKAKSVSGDHPNSWIIGADTVVVKDDIVLGKPVDRDDALRMLKFLSGATHSVFTGYCVLNSNNGKYLKGFEKTEVTFRKISDEMAAHYVDHFHPFDKAGSYAIQDFSTVFLERINGCFYNVVGFPLSKFYNQILNDLSDCL